MSLSARIAVGPSLRVTLMAIVVTTGGFFVAGVTVAAGQPDAMPVVVATTVAGWAFAIAAILERHAHASRLVLSVSDRVDIGVDGSERAWRLIVPTMSWSCFSVLVLAENDASPRPVLLRYPLFGVDIAMADRRALSRFLTWSLRGGGTVGHP